MMSNILKHLDLNLVSLRFEKALPTYNEHAVVQKQMAEKLVSSIRGNINTDLNKVFEIGCGTGMLTQSLFDTFTINQYIANDLVGKAEPIIKEIVRNSSCEKFQFCEGDGNHIEFPEKCQMICSGATIQWFTDVDGFVQKAINSLVQGGILAFSTFGLSHFSEIRQLTGEGLDYLSASEMVIKCSKHLKLLNAEEWIQTMGFDSPFDVLHHIKATGVGGTATHHWNKNILFRFVTDYEKFKTDGGKYKLTYQPQIFVFKKI